MSIFTCHSFLISSFNYKYGYFCEFLLFVNYENDNCCKYERSRGNIYEIEKRANIIISDMKTMLLGSYQYYLENTIILISIRTIG